MQSPSSIKTLLWLKYSLWTISTILWDLFVGKLSLTLSLAISLLLGCVLILPCALTFRSEAKCFLSDDWVQRQRRVVQQHKSQYKRIAWAKVASEIQVLTIFPAGSNFVFLCWRIWISFLVCKQPNYLNAWCYEPKIVSRVSVQILECISAQGLISSDGTGNSSGASRSAVKDRLHFSFCFC